MSSENEIESALGAAGFDMEQANLENVEITTPTDNGIPEGVTADFDFSEAEQSTEEVAPAVEAEQPQEVSEEPTSVEPTENSLNTETAEPAFEMSDDVVAKYLSETLGVELNSLDALKDMMAPQQADIDERVKVIADFVEKTGRSPEDWFKYQAVDPSEMDDYSAVKMSMASEYTDLSTEEIDMLVGSKYKLDEDLYTEDEIKLSKLQLKIDANKSRKSIDELRSSYMIPEARQTEDTTVQSPIDENWLSAMKKETQALEALTFELPSGEFNFGITDDYKSQLIDKNTNIESFFDQYIDKSGEWDYDTFNTHRAVVDNIDAIAKSVYQQGLSDGQRKIVDQAANVSAKTPGVGQTSPQDNLSQQILDALGADKTLKFL